MVKVDEQAVIIIALVAVAGFVAYSVSKNPITAYGGLSGKIQDATYEEFINVFGDMEQQVKGNLSGPPGLDPRLIQDISNFRDRVRVYMDNLDSSFEPDIIATLEQHMQTSGAWLDRAYSIQAQQEAMVRQMKGAPRSDLAIRNKVSRPLQQAIKTGNDKFSTPGPFSAQLVQYKPQTQVTLHQTVDPETGRFYGSQDTYQPDKALFLQGNSVNDGFSAQGPGGPLALDFTGANFEQVSDRPNLLLRQATDEVNTGMTEPPLMITGGSFSQPIVLRPLPKDSPPPSVAGSPPPEMGTFGSFGGAFGGFGQVSNAASLYGGEEFVDIDVLENRPPQIPATVPEEGSSGFTDFNQQGSFDVGEETDTIARTREEAAEKEKLGDMAGAAKLVHQADTQQFGALQPKDKKPVWQIPVDNDYMTAVAGIAAKIDLTNNKDSIRIYITTLEQTVPRQYRMRKPSWLSPEKGSPVLNTAEYREFARVRKLGQKKLGYGRVRSGSFLLPETVREDPFKRTKKGGDDDPNEF